MAFRSLVRVTGLNPSKLNTPTTRRLTTATVTEHGNKFHLHPPPPQPTKPTPKKTGAAEYVPIYVLFGMMATSVGFGLYTAKHKLLHAPDVRVKKSKRETLAEVVAPEEVVDEAGKLVTHSLFRKLAHLKEFRTPADPPEPFLGDVVQARKPRVETLKTVGIDPNNC